MSRSARVAASAVVVASISWGFVAVPAQAADNLSVGLDALGQRRSIELSGSPATSTMTLAVPAGLRPDMLSGTIDVGPDTSSDILEVSDSTHRLASVDLAGRAGHSVSLNVPLGGAAVDDHAVTLTFDLSTTDGRCRVPTGSPTTVRDLALRYSGAEIAPTTVADFLPPALRRLDLYVPDNASSEVKAATVTLAGSVAARYNPARPEIRVHTLTDANAVRPTTPLTRAVILPGTGTAGLKLAAQPRVLTVTGSGAELAAQVDALNGNLGTIALTSRAVASRAQARPQLPPSTQTLSVLGLNQVDASGRGSARATMAVDSAALGLPASSWSTHLFGTVTTGAEPSSSDSRGTLTLTANGTAVASWPIPEDGRFDVRPAVAGAGLGRYTTLSLTATANGSGDCATLPLIDVTVDPGSTLKAVREPAAPFSGFSDLPAVLRPSYQIATSGQTVADLDQAASLAVSLQRQVQVALDPQLVDVDTLVASKMPAVLVAGTVLPAGVTLPLAATNARVSLADGSSLDGNAALATFQVSAAGGRYLGVVSGTRPELVTGLTRWLADSQQLGSLDGDVAVYDASGQVRTLSLEVQDPLPVQDTAAAATPFGSFARIVSAGVVAMLLLAVGLAIGYTANRRRTGAPGPRTPADGDPGWTWSAATSESPNP